MRRILGETLGRSTRQECNRESEAASFNDAIYLSSLYQDEMIIDCILKNFDKEGIWDHPVSEI